MYALLESSDAISLFQNENLISTYKFQDVVHAQKFFEDIIKGKFPDEILEFLKDNEVNDIIVDKSLLKAHINKNFNLRLVEDQRKLRALREKQKCNLQSIRTLSHFTAHKNVNFYTLDPLIAQSYSLYKQLENDLEKYDKRAAEIYFNYLPELNIRKKRSENDDERVEYKEMYDIEVIKKLWKIKERGAEKSLEDEGSKRRKINNSKKSKSSNVLDEKYLWVKNSVGIELSENDWENLQRIIDMFDEKYGNKARLLEYLQAKIETHAPNLNALLGFRTTAEMIMLCGSLLSLAKCSSSTVQVLGAEKALFRSLKNKTNTPKYGILKNNEITNSPRIIRSLASKIVLCARIDVFRKRKTDLYGRALRTALEEKVKDDKKIMTVEILAKVSGELKALEKEEVHESINAEDSMTNPGLIELDENPLEIEKENITSEKSKPKKGLMIKDKKELKAKKNKKSKSQDESESDVKKKSKSQDKEESKSQDESESDIKEEKKAMDKKKSKSQDESESDIKEEKKAMDKKKSKSQDESESDIKEEKKAMDKKKSKSQDESESDIKEEKKAMDKKKSKSQDESESDIKEEKKAMDKKKSKSQNESESDIKEEKKAMDKKKSKSQDESESDIKEEKKAMDKKKSKAQDESESDIKEEKKMKKKDKKELKAKKKKKSKSQDESESDIKEEKMLNEKRKTMTKKPEENATIKKYKKKFNLENSMEMEMNEEAEVNCESDKKIKRKGVRRFASVSTTPRKRRKESEF